MDIRNIDIEKVAKAVELDAGQALPGLRESLAQAKRGEFAVVHTPEMIAGYSQLGAPTLWPAKRISNRPKLFF